MKKILLVGGSGFLGQGIAERYRSEGHEVTTIGRSLCSDIVVDFECEDVLSAVSSDYDMLIHAAAINEVFINDDIGKTYFINVTVTRILVELAKNLKIKQFIYISTFHVYGRSHGEINEETVPFPINDYGLTHLLSESIVTNLGKANNIETLIVRPTNIYGIPVNIKKFNRWSLVPFAFVKSAIEKGVITLASSGLQQRNFVSIDSVIDTFCLVGDVKVVNAIGVSTLSIYDFATLVASSVGLLLSREIAVHRVSVEGGMINELNISSISDLQEDENSLLLFIQFFAEALVENG
mgnify:CR=1 FL=1